MPAPTVAEMLKYANLQMAAEALYDFNTKKRDPASLVPGEHYVGPIQSNWLTDGNEHASRFTQTEAAKFVAQWEVVDHLSNTTTGFSGTLFRALKDDPTQGIKAGELTLSFRSTEFIDDTVRDSVATNVQEIKAYGWAFGQIADMKKWYAQLQAAGKLPASAHFSVTGYSLGGHLATAFNLLRREDGSIGQIDQVVTFNGAGVGQVTSGTLTQVINDFNHLRNTPSDIAALFTDTRLRDVYLALRGHIAGGIGPTAADYALLNNVAPDQLGTEYQLQQFADEKTWIRSAMDRIKALQTEVTRLQTVTDSVSGAPANIPNSAIAQEDLDYQMAVLKVQEKTDAKDLIPGAINAVFGKSYATPALTNQFDVVGRETTTTQTAMVSDSQWHYGTNIDAFIEDQPLVRGTITKADAGTYWDVGGFVPLSEYSKNDFGDTHSLVLIVDSLNIQNALKALDPNLSQSTAESIFKASSALVATMATGSDGKAEGEVLESVLDALVNTFTHTDPKLRTGKTSAGLDLNTGGTWADKTLRENFYDKLDLLQKNQSFKDLAGKVTLSLPNTGSLASTAHTDFASLLTLLTLSPFTLKAVARTKGVSLAFFLEPSCHVAPALN